MHKLASVIDDIVANAKAERVKIANDSLSAKKSEPTISSDLGISLVKVANLLRDAEVEVSYEDIKALIGQVKND